MKTVFINCNLISGEKDCSLQENMAVTVENGKIIDIGKTAAEYKDCKIIDLKGKFLMPGLINMHAHLFGTGKPSKALGGGDQQKKLIKFVNSKLGLKVIRLLVKSSVKTQLLSGVTTVRSVGDFRYSDVFIRDKINAGKMTGPRLLVSGPAITVTGGHGAGTFAYFADKPEDLRKLVHKNAEAGVDFIKICVTGGVMDAKKKGEPGELRMNLEQTKAVCDEAHKIGLKVASHTESQDGVRITIAAHVDTIEHGSALDGQMKKDLKAYGGALVPTYSPALPLAKLDPEITLLSPLCIYNSEIVLNNMTLGAKDGIACGIPIGVGTDASCPFSTQYNTWREVCCFAKYVGVSNSFAIYSATLGNAEIMGLQDETGSVSIGKSADMIVLNCNPLENLSALKDPEIVVMKGKIINKPKVKKSEFIEGHLDKMFKQLEIC